MCLNPVLIKNPNYRHTVKNSHDVYVYLKDVTSQYIEVKCGHCVECSMLKQTYIRQRSSLMAQTHDIYFVTLTYSPSMLPYVDINGIRHNYADIHDFQTMVKYMRKINFFGKPFKYICCTEYGSKRHRPHFHVLFFVPKDTDVFRDQWDYMERERFYFHALLKLWRRNISTDIKTSDTAKKRIRVNTRNAVYKPLCRFIRDSRGRSTYDFHQVVPKRTKNGVLDVCTYVTKYCLKFDPWIVKKQQALHLNLSDEDYKRYWQILKPRVLISKNFGNDDVFLPLVRKGINTAINRREKYFLFIDPTTGKESPLSPYLRKYFATIDDKISLYNNSPQRDDNVVDLSDDYFGYAYEFRNDKSKRILSMLIARNTDEFYELE